MNGRCNEIFLNEGALMAALTESARQGLLAEGEALLSIMRAEVGRTTHGGAPGKPAWRAEIAANLEHVAATVSLDGISVDFGYSPSGQADEVRAMVVNEGLGQRSRRRGNPRRSYGQKRMGRETCRQTSLPGPK